MFKRVHIATAVCGCRNLCSRDIFCILITNKQTHTHTLCSIVDEMGWLRECTHLNLLRTFNACLFFFILFSLVHDKCMARFIGGSFSVDFIILFWCFIVVGTLFLPSRLKHALLIHSSMERLVMKRSGGIMWIWASQENEKSAAYSNQIMMMRQ